MAIYFGTFIVSYLFCWYGERLSNHKKEKKAHVMLALAALVPSVLAGIRDYTIGTDIATYGHWLFIAAQNAKNPITFALSKTSIDFLYAVDYIFHCASITASKMMIEKPVETLLISVEGTKNILNFAQEKKCASVVYISSMEVYGAFNESKEVREENLGYIDHLKVRSNYPESKRLCENMCVAYYTEFGVPVKIARLAQTFGAGILPGENRVFAQFARSAMQGKDIVLHTKGQSEGNYCYTRDCITGLLTILLKGTNAEAYNVSNPRTHTTIAEMANLVAEKIADGKIKVVFDIPEDNTFGYAADTKMKLNSDKLQALGWKPEVALEEAYRRMMGEL